VSLHHIHHLAHPHRAVGGGRPSDMMFRHMNHARDLSRAGRMGKTSQTMKGKGKGGQQQRQQNSQQSQQQQQNGSGGSQSKQKRSGSSSRSNHRGRR
jgi:hypothetical protein